LAKAKAHWVNRDTIAWHGADPTAKNSALALRVCPLSVLSLAQQPVKILFFWEDFPRIALLP